MGSKILPLPLPPAPSPGSTSMFQHMAQKNPSYLYRTRFWFAWNFYSIYLCLADKNITVCWILLPQIPLNPNPRFPLYPHPSQNLHRIWAKRGLCCSLAEAWLLPCKSSQGFVSWGLTGTRNSVKPSQTPRPCLQCWLRLQKEFFTVNHTACQMEARISFPSHLIQFIAKGCHLAFLSVV